MISATVAGTTQRRKPSVIVPNSSFSITHARSETDMMVVESIRQLAYCVDRPFETFESEDDGVNPQSLHAYISFSGKPVGVSRITLGDMVEELPFLKHCTEKPSREIICAMGEIGRFACSKQAKKEAGLSNTVRDSIPLILYNLKATLEMSACAGIKYWGMFIDARLKSCIEEFGGVLPAAGPSKCWPVNTKFLRVPCIVSIRDFSENMRLHNEDHWNFLTDKGSLMDQIPSD
ncbi:MAG: hypothetical protein RJA61_62 [Candidatus Parcubacteria bacterium]|jgi:N-acyl amino acid synthase of PEP-CTERM/exosortase system